jgi:hypothetical protein
LQRVAGRSGRTTRSCPTSWGLLLAAAYRTRRPGGTCARGSPAAWRSTTRRSARRWGAPRPAPSQPGRQAQLGQRVLGRLDPPAVHRGVAQVAPRLGWFYCGIRTYVKSFPYIETVAVAAGRVGSASSAAARGGLGARCRGGKGARPASRPPPPATFWRRAADRPGKRCLGTVLQAGLNSRLKSRLWTPARKRASPRPASSQPTINRWRNRL